MPPLEDTNFVVGEGFEPSKAEPTDLQSVPFGHLGTPPKTKKCKPNHDLGTRPIKAKSWRRDLNPQPADYKSAALPIELSAGVYMPPWKDRQLKYVLFKSKFFSSAVEKPHKRGFQLPLRRLKLSSFPVNGIVTTSSQISFVSLRNPLPSAPTTITVGCRDQVYRLHTVEICSDRPATPFLEPCEEHERGWIPWQQAESHWHQPMFLTPWN